MIISCVTVGLKFYLFSLLLSVEALGLVVLLARTLLRTEGPAALSALHSLALLQKLVAAEAYWRSHLKTVIKFLIDQ